MPIMSGVKRAFCVNPLWNMLTDRVVVPRVFAGVDLHGEVLEIGSAGGANAAALLGRYDDIEMALTDVDPAMRSRAEARVAAFGGRAQVVEADATALGFDDDSFDAVVSMLMLHHVIDWETALAEIARVLRPGGIFVGYDLSAGFSSRLCPLGISEKLRSGGDRLVDAERTEPGHDHCGRTSDPAHRYHP